MAAAVEEVLGAALMAAEAACRLGQRARRLRPPARADQPARRPAGRGERAHGGRRRGRGRDPRPGRVARPRDLCLCLISGGGSALMPAPVEGITLDDKLAVTRHLERGRGQHRTAQHGPQAAQPHQGRRAGAGLPRRAAGVADDLRRAGRPAGRDRLGPDRRGPLHAAGRAGRARTVRRPRRRRLAGRVRLSPEAKGRQESGGRNSQTGGLSTFGPSTRRVPTAPR